MASGGGSTSGGLAKYALGKELGAGAFGKVHQAVHKQSRDVVAVKTVLKKGLKSHDVEAVKREMDILEWCGEGHPHIVRYVVRYTWVMFATHHPPSFFRSLPTTLFILRNQQGIVRR